MPQGRALTDNEGALLSLVMRHQPVTAYQIGKIFASSPVHTFNTSKGKLYPMIARLEERGLLAAEAVPDDHRGTKRFACTDAGRQVLRNWIGALSPEHDLLADPLRKKVQAFQLLTADEQLDWIARARQRLEAKLQEVERWSPETEGPFGALVQDNARAALRARVGWLEEARRAVAGREGAEH